MKRVKSFFVFFTACLFFAAPAFALTAEVADISNREYYGAVLREVNGAKHSIDVAMYSMYAREDEAAGAVARLITALGAARKRGVNVTVYLDRSPSTGKANDEAYRMLAAAGVKVFYTGMKHKMHAKLIVIDGEVVIDGSANWTNKAIGENDESNLIVRSKEFGAIKQRFFAGLTTGMPKIESADREPGADVPISFLTDKRLAARMTRAGDINAFDFYIWLLGQCRRSGNKAEWIAVDYDVMADHLGITIEHKKSLYRNKVRACAQKLKQRYGLIDYHLNEKNALWVLPVFTEQENYFKLPDGFWDYGWDSKLNLREKFFYLVCCYEGARALPAAYWRCSMQGLAKKYALDRSTLSLAATALKKQDLIEVRYGRVQGDDYSDKEVNEYRVKPMLSPKVRARLQENMEKEFGVDTFVAAREAAAAIDRGEDLEVIGDFADLIRKHGKGVVRLALEEIAEYKHNNPLRNTAYIAGIIRRIEQGKE